MPRTAALTIVCVAAFILGPASHYVALISLGGFLDGSASSDMKGVVSLVFALFGWVPGAIAAAALAIPLRVISFGDGMNLAGGAAFIGMLTSCAVGPTNPFG